MPTPLLFGRLAYAVDHIAHPGTEQLKKRCCGTLEITGAIPEFMSLAATSDLPIDIDQVPLAAPAAVPLVLRAIGHVRG